MNATGQQLDVYRQSAVNTASPLELVIMLYDGALRFLHAGRRAMVAKDLDKQNEALTKTQRIITELTVCLDMERGGDIAPNLMGLYAYMNNLLVEANIYDQVEKVDEVIKMLGELRSSWGQVREVISLDAS